MTLWGARQMPMFSRQLFKATQSGESGAAAAAALHSLFCSQREKHCHPFSQGATDEAGRSPRCRRGHAALFSSACYTFMPTFQRVLLIYKPLRNVKERARGKKSAWSRGCSWMSSSGLVFGFQTPGHAGRWGLRQAAPDADWESRFGYGGAGDSPIGSKRFEWASPEQSKAPPPSQNQANSITER